MSLADGPLAADPRFVVAAKYAQAGLAAQAWDIVRDVAMSEAASYDELHACAEVAHCASDHGAALVLLDRARAVLKALGRLQEAAASYEQAAATAPESAEAWNGLGLVRQALDDPSGALAAFAAALRAVPHFLPSRTNLAALYVALGQFAAAVAVCEEALAIDPGYAAARINLAAALIEQGRHGDAAEALGRVAAEPAAADTALYVLHYCSNDPAAVMRAHGGWGARAPAAAAMVRSAIPRRQRIGYVSQDFRRHSVSFFTEPLLTGHDKQRVEIFCYATGGPSDAVTERFKGYADHWTDISPLSDDSACQLIRAHELDVLVDLAGHTRGHRLGIFARRAAAIQVTAIGYPGTTGLSQIDYRLCDAITDPAGTDAYASERLIRLPRLHCYRPVDDAPAVAPLPALSVGHVTFGSFNKLGKVSDATIALWAQVLARLPGARLFLKSKALAEEATRSLTAARFAAFGVAPERLTLLGWAPDDEGHLGTYRHVDIALDTFPYSGTTTTCEALWMGVPVLTLAGATHASRVSASLLTTVGMTDWIADTADQFIVQAIAAASDLPALSALRAALRNQVATSPLCDAAGYAAAVEAAYRAM